MTGRHTPKATLKQRPLEKACCVGIDGLPVTLFTSAASSPGQPAHQSGGHFFLFALDRLICIRFVLHLKYILIYLEKECSLLATFTGVVNKISKAIVKLGKDK